MRTPIVVLSSANTRAFSGPCRRRVPAATLLFVIRGDGVLRIGERLHAVMPQRLFLLAGASEAELVSGNIECQLLFVRSFSPTGRGGYDASGRGLFELFGLPAESAEVPLRNAAKLSDCLQRLRDCSASGRARVEPIAWQAEFLVFLHAAIAEAGAAKAERSPKPGIERSIAFMHAHFDQKIRLESLSEIAGFAPTSYSREFKKQKGKPPIEYLNAYRIGQAKRMLMERGSSVKKTAAASGFGNEFYFSRLFKREVGISPTLYMKRKEIRIAVASTLRLQDMLRSLGVEPVVSVNCHPAKTAARQEHEALLADLMQRIRGSEPELIVCDHYHRPYLDSLRAIAPTVICSEEMDWMAIYLRIADLVGREEEARGREKMLERKTRETKAILHERYEGETFTVMRIIHHLVRVQGKSGHPLNDLLYTDLDLKPGFCVPTGAMSTEYSPDKLPDLDTDHLFVQNLFFYPEDRSLLEAIRSKPQWGEITAVRRNQVRYIGNWAADSWSPDGRMRILDELCHEAVGLHASTSADRQK